MTLEGLLVELDVPVGKRYCYSQALKELYGLIGNPYCSDAALEKTVNDYLADSGDEDSCRFAMFLVVKLVQKLMSM